MMEVDKKKTRTDEAWVRLYARFETDCLLPADAEHCLLYTSPSPRD